MMSDDLSITNQKMQQTSGSLAHINEQKGQSQPQSTIAESPFRRSSLINRSPPPGPIVVKPCTVQLDRVFVSTPPPHNTEAAETAPRKTPETQRAQAKHAPFLSPDEKNAETAKQTVDAELKRMKDTILDMRSATLRQKNVSHDIKNGLETLAFSVEVIESMQKLWQISLKRIKDTESKQTQAPSPSSAPANVVSYADAVLSGGKRLATSPPATEREDKRPKDSGVLEESDQFQPVLTKAQRKRAKAKSRARERAGRVKEVSSETRPKAEKRRGPRQRHEALLIRPSAGKSYADVLGEIRQKVKPEDKGAVIKSLRKTKAGDLLVELGQPLDTQGGFKEDLQTALGSDATVRVLETKVALEVRDLDELATEGEVSSSLKAALASAVEAKVFVSKANARGQKMAVVTLGAKDADTLLKKGRLKVGWVSCRVREKLVPPRCFRCLGFGHVANQCNGPDRSKMCFKCGSPDHKASACSSEESCVLCVDSGLKDNLIKHAAGSSRCKSYKEALVKIRASNK